jgi:glutamate carboxypeptidase
MSAQDALNWIDEQRTSLTQLLMRWSGINSGTFNTRGLAEMEREVGDAFSPLADRIETIELAPAQTIGPDGKANSAPLGRALRFIRRPNASLRVLLSIHYDTVFDANSPFQHARLEDADTLIGPGVVDAKGGIVVMLTALRALERSDAAGGIGWEVLLNPDEEIGSPGSAPLLIEAAKLNHFGLVFEPAFPDGALVGARKGSGGFTIVVQGRAAHAGRDFASGRSAILALAEMITRLQAVDRPGAIINCGKIEGGGALNIVPDLAIGRFNVRAESADDQAWVEQRFREETIRAQQTEGIHVEFHGGFLSRPKPLDPGSTRLMEQIIATGHELGLSLSYRPSGGTCDGNKLAAAGLAVVDSLGPVGGALHSDREYVQISSLTGRAKLIALLLMKFAGGNLRLH